MAPVGQASTHCMQRRHLSKSMSGKPSTSRRAPNLQARWHLPQPMQPAVQACRTTLPLKCAEQALCTGWLAVISCSTPRGQAVRQTPQPTHFSSSTAARRPSTTWMAPKGQAASQSPKPRQLYSQALSPLATSAALLQSRGPS